MLESLRSLLMPRWARSKGVLTALILAVGCLMLSQPARADWYDIEGASPPPTNFGPDYDAAAYASLINHYGNPDYLVSAHMSYNRDGQPIDYSKCGKYGIWTYCGDSTNDCPSGTVYVLTGCASAIPSYQGSPNCKPGRPNCGAGDPIDVLSGNVFESATDFATTGQDVLSSRRFYNSYNTYISTQPAAASRFGSGWRSEYDTNLVFPFPASSSSSFNAITADGNPLHFVQSGSNWYLAYFSSGGWSSASSPRTGADYRASTDGTYWYITDPNDTVSKYSVVTNGGGQGIGTLQSITYRGGYQQTLTYDGSGHNTVVSDSLGRSITFHYNANGLVDTLTDPDGNVTSYTYEERSGSSPAPGGGGIYVLQTVTYPAASGTPTLTYIYDDPNPINQIALTGITDENGNRLATWTYDSTSGRALSSELAGGADQTTISYNDTTGIRTVTNALSKQFVYNTASFQSSLQLSSVAGQASAHTAAATTSYLYDTNGFVSQITDGNGNINKYAHNAVGEETSRTEGYGTAVARTITTTWDTTWREPDEIVRPNLTTDFTYDTSGRLTQLKETDTTTQSVPYSTNGQTRIWAYTYYTSAGLVGLLHTVDGPLSGTGDTVTYGYNSYGFVNSITDQLGHVTNITSINGRGQPLTSVDPNSVTTNYTYDLRGRILTVTVNPGASQSETQFTYDAAGNLTIITLPDASTLTYAYDNAHRLTSVTNNLGESITYTLDALGNRTATVVKSATSTITKQQTATFDELGRVMANIGAASQTTSYTYDLDNNQVTTTDPRSKLYDHAFDALNRLYQETDPNSYQTTIAYNAKDEVTGVTDARSLVTSYVRDGFGDAIQQTSPDTGTTVFWYDANGNVTKQVDARSIETDFTYDNASRILTKTFPAASSENVAYTYDSTSGGNDGIGRLTSLTDQSGSDALVYDALGRVSSDTRIIGSNSYGTSYTYDAAGNILTETYPSGRIVTYARDALGRIFGITTKQNSGSSAVTVVSSVGYEPFGPLSALTFGNSVAAAFTYDQDYQLTDIYAAAGATAIQNLTNGFDPSGNITSITDHLASSRTQTLGYDNLNRLNSASGLYGSQSYTYDGVGNRLTRVVGSTTDTYAYSSTANQISTVTTGSNVRSFTYLPSGQVSQDVRDPSDTYTFAANDNGRNASASLNSSTVGSYLYNAFEQRVQKVAGGVTTQFVFDRFGHLLEEANASGVVQKEYIWLDDLPVAMVDDTGSSPVLYFIHTDQLGTPQKITDASASIVWDGVFDPFGNTVSLGGSLWGTAKWGGFNWGGLTNNLRFPGQYADAETELNQNWNRDYDPTIGRYIESDPVGVVAGLNTYSYVLDNPFYAVDPGGKTALTNWNYFWSWALGTGSRRRNYGPHDVETQEMQASQAARDMREAFAQAHCHTVKNIGYSTRQAYLDTSFYPDTADTNSTAWEVGGFAGASVTNNGDGTATFDIPNVSGTHSFFYHLVPNTPWRSGPMSNIYQNFKWKEPINECGCSK